jgi:hypothetical protein
LKAKRNRAEGFGKLAACHVKVKVQPRDKSAFKTTAKKNPKCFA